MDRTLEDSREGDPIRLEPLKWGFDDRISLVKYHAISSHRSPMNNTEISAFDKYDFDDPRIVGWDYPALSFSNQIELLNGGIQWEGW